MNPSPNNTPLIAELRTSLLDCAIELASLERLISRRGLPGSFRALRLRLGVISMLTDEMRAGTDVSTWLEKMHVTLIDDSIRRLRSEIAALPPEAPPPTVGA